MPLRARGSCFRPGLNIPQEMFFCFHQGVELGCAVDAVGCCGGGNGGPGAAMGKRLVDAGDWGAEDVFGI